MDIINTLSSETFEDTDKIDLTKDAHVFSNVPTLSYFEKTYGKICDGNDQKAISIFKIYESAEMFRRLQQELMWLKNNLVKEKICKEILGLKRPQKYGSFINWASLMLIWGNTARKY